MKKYEGWELHFVPECFFDTVLVKALLSTKKNLLHKRGCSNVFNELQNAGLKDDFAVAIIDKDKKEEDYFKNCDIVFDDCKLLIWKKRERLHFIIQLNPPLEKWIIQILDENKLIIESFGYSRNYKALKKQIKNDIDKEKDENLNNLVKAIINTNCEAIRKMKAILIYLKEKNYAADINELRNV